MANEPTFAAGAGAEYRLIGSREPGRLVAFVRTHLSGDAAEFLQVGYRGRHTTEAAPTYWCISPMACTVG